MKTRHVFAALVAALLTGCTLTVFQDGQRKLVRMSLGTSAEVKELSITKDGDAKLVGFTNEQAAVATQAIQTAGDALKK